MQGSFCRKLAAALVCSVLGTAALAGCGPSREEPEAARRSPAAEAEWAWLQKAQRTLAEQRARLAAVDPADSKNAAAREALRKQTAELNARLVAFINADPPVQGQPLTRRQQAAIRMKSDEDILLAREFIDTGGDYQRAMEIYKEALAIDPGYARLEEELARAQARRYTSREVFAQLKKGMSQDEVRALLGPPNLHSVRDYPDRGVVGWFYPKDASGAAAAVWFAKSNGGDGGNGGNGGYAVYLFDFDALQPPAPGATPPEPPRMPQTPQMPAAT
jgi:tetratricopeptide (TPR) repeat protein